MYKLLFIGALFVSAMVLQLADHQAETQALYIDRIENIID